MIFDKDWFIAAYDEVLSKEPEGVPVEKSRDAVAHRYADAVENGEAPYVEPHVAQGRSLFNRWVSPERTVRRDRMRADVEWIAAAVRGETILGTGSPSFGRAYPLGNGADKTLRLWSAEDWEGARLERHRNAAATAVAASQFDVAATAVIDAMKDRGCRFTGDLLQGEAS